MPRTILVALLAVIVLNAAISFGLAEWRAGAGGVGPAGPPGPSGAAGAVATMDARAANCEAVIKAGISNIYLLDAYERYCP